ncbi:MAG: porin [Saprospiraceae bacterium]|nr:porin [Saprospiraceae bacterium]
MLFFSALLHAQDTTALQVTTSQKPAVTETPSKKWYDQISLRGYAQFRYNRLLETNPDLKCEQCDKSWGDNNGFFFRRIRLVISGNVHDRVYIYIQPDFANSISGNNHIAQIRDAYVDLALDKDKTYRLRFGQSKIPYGFENLQSSQNRIPLDRNDGLNSAAPNERDMAVFGYWAPKKIRERFAYLVNSGLKGSGDYGVVGMGVYNGQSANKPELNNGFHAVGRVSYPFLLKNGQIIEAGIQGYTGNVIVSSVTKDIQGINPDFSYEDSRVAASFIVYPQPLGFQAEYNIGTGPQYNPETNTIDQKPLKGGYAMLSYRIQSGKQLFFPFVRYHYYEGGKKQELDARSYHVNESEVGVEWQLNKYFEFVAMYTMSARRFEDAVNSDNYQQGNLLRLQVQFNY